MDLETIRNSIVGNSSFSITDYIVVGFSLAVVLCCGFYHGLFFPSSREDFLVGGRVMRSSPIAGKGIFANYFSHEHCMYVLN